MLCVSYGCDIDTVWGFVPAVETHLCSKSNCEILCQWSFFFFLWKWKQGCFWCCLLAKCIFLWVSCLNLQTFHTLSKVQCSGFRETQGQKCDTIFINMFLFTWNYRLLCFCFLRMSLSHVQSPPCSSVLCRRPAVATKRELNNKSFAFWRLDFKINFTSIWCSAFSQLNLGRKSHFIFITTFSLTLTSHEPKSCFSLPYSRLHREQVLFHSPPCCTAMFLQ